VSEREEPSLSQSPSPLPSPGRDKVKIYLDTSALNRIFDDQSHPHIYLEATAMLIIFMLIESQSIEIVSSDVLMFENVKNPYSERQKFVDLILSKTNEYQTINEKIVNRAQAIEKLNIKGIDVLHLACAEELGVNCFITCDKRILKNYKGPIEVKNPVDFITNVLQKEENQ